MTELPALALRALPVLERTQSVTRAAAELGVSQPAVSRAVAELEHRVGVAILVRGRAGVVLTTEGKRIAIMAVQEAALRADALREVELLRRRRAGLVRIGSFGASASTGLLPNLMAGFAARHGDVAISVREMVDEDLPSALRAGVLDLAILVKQDDPSFEMLPLTRDRLVALLPEGDATEGPLDPGSIVARPFIMTKGGSEPYVRRWFARAGFEPRVDHEVQQITSILAFVRAGLGISVVAERALPDHRPGLRVVALRPHAPRDIVLARQASAPLSVAAGAFWDHAVRKGT